MLLNALELLAGAAIALMTLRDVFDTVVVPGESRATLRVARRVVFVMLPLWRLARPRRGISPTFAPAVLVASFVIWMGLLAVGFAAMAHAMGHLFRPTLVSFSDALYLSASSIVTLGLSETDATGAARWVIVGGGFCGLAVMTMAVTYLLMVQSSVSKRDIGIIKLNTSAGDPPSALALLENYASTGNCSELPHMLREARDWCTTVRQSHASHPSLIYFRSISTGSGWPAALGALLDLSLIARAILDDEELRGPAVLLRADGARMGEELAQLVGLEAAPVETTEEEVDQLVRRLRESGYRVRDTVDTGDVLNERRLDMGWVQAMADHLGKAPAPLLPDQAARR